jgi:GrpB-like predicted nucleotidyltransferase (UPF0157 family)
LRAHPDVAGQYGELKQRLAGEHKKDRVAYTRAKTDFIDKVTGIAKQMHKGNFKDVTT